MRRGLESGLVLGSSKGTYDGLHNGLSGMSMHDRFNSLNPSHITEPKLKPIFYVNADNVALTSGTVSLMYNLIDKRSTDVLVTVENIISQTAGTTYRPPIVLGGLGGKNYMQFADTGNRYLTNEIASLYSQNSPAATCTGFTYMFVIKRLQGATRSILDARDGTTLPTPGDLLLEVTSDGRISFDYDGGVAGTVTTIVGTAGVNLLNNWSILTVKCQLRIDGGRIPGDTDSPSIAKRYANPNGARLGSESPIDIFVNGIEQYKNITTNTFTNSDYFGDGSYRVLDRDIFIGNKGSTFGTSGSHIAAIVLIPAYISNALQTRIENYFRSYYNQPF